MRDRRSGIRYAGSRIRDPRPGDSLLLAASLRQRAVVLLDQLAVLLRHVVAVREEDLAGVAVELAAERVFEALDVVAHRLLETREPLGIRVGALVVELAQPFQ